MSAICGMIGLAAAESERTLAGMLAAMRSRGPGGAAIHVDERRQIALGIRSLPVSSTEADPEMFTSEDGSLSMVCDGQVFNHAEVTSWLRGRGHSVRGAHSAELLLHLFEEEGDDGFRRADAQFALAIWDSKKNRVILARDFLGVRSLYYCAGKHGVIFASEIKGLLQHPRTPRAVDEIAASHFLTFLNVPGPRTLFEGISKLPPGTCAVCTPQGNVELSQFWSLLRDPVPETDDMESYVDRVRDLHSSAVSRRTAETPIACLLSGGNDSSANAAYLARFGCQPLHTVTVGLAEFEGDAKYNDLIYAKKVADLIGSNHHELLLSTDEFLQTIPLTVAAMDDMVSEPSSIFLYHALKIARESGSRVVITGEANDELCCGHGEMIRIRERYYQKWAPFMQKPAMVRKLAAMLAPMFSPKRTDILRRAAENDEYFWNFEIAWMDSDKDEILTPEMFERCRAHTGSAVVARYAKEFRATEHGGRDYLNYIVYVMMQNYYFGNLMLGKLDLLSSAIGIEARCPYTDPSYARLAFNVPAKFKAHGDMVKFFFKKAIEGVLPDEIIYRPKQGFRTPVVELFKGRLGDWSEPHLLESGLTKSGFLRRDSLERLLAQHRRGERDYSNRLWTALMLNMWYERWISPCRVHDSIQASDGCDEANKSLTAPPSVLA